MVRIIGNHEDTGFGAQLLQVGGDTRNLHRSLLRGLQFGVAQREFDTTGKHLHGTNLKRCLTCINQCDLSSLFRFPAKVGEIDIGGRYLQLGGQCLTYVVIVLEVRQKNCRDRHLIVLTHLLTQLLGNIDGCLVQTEVAEFLRIQGDGDSTRL